MHQSLTEQSSEYLEGVEAYKQGLHVDLNPHTSQNGRSQQRIDWFNGYYDSWRQEKYGPDETTEEI